MGQLSKQLSGLPSNTFSANAKKISKDHSSVILMDERIIFKSKGEGVEGPEEEFHDKAYKVNQQYLPKKKVNPDVVV